MTFLEVALEASRSGCEALLLHWGKLEAIEQKTSFSDLVTEADKASEQAIIKVIKHYYPEHTILAEESGLEAGQNAEYSWIIDPLDGTTNYTHLYPVFATSIALCYQGDPIVGVIQNPYQKELFKAEKGKGAYLNDKRLKVSKAETLDTSLLATGFAYDRQKSPETNYKEFAKLTHLTQGVRRGGSAALDLAYVAAGRLDGYWERGLQPWDVAAGSLMVEEAGGRVTGYDGNRLDIYGGRILASNGKVHPLLYQALMETP
ncbi:MAG: inositol monophosphatase [Chlamydiia bacterium]|nr:inositol monophosphatase [Chlamydiia bacterium]